MLEWLSTYGLDILLGILSGGGLYAGISGIVRTIKLNKKIDKTVDEKIGKVQEDIVITQEGVIQAFKQAILGNDFKISINNQIDKKLTDFAEKLISTIKENEELRTRLTVLTAIILKNTAAYNKLTDEEKGEMNVLINNLGESINIEVEDDSVKVEDDSVKGE